MKNTHLWVGLGFLAIVSVGLLSQIGSVTEVSTKVEERVVTEEVHPDWATDEDAVKAAQDVIRKKELEAQEAELVSQITSLQEELDEVRKELGTY